MKLTLEEMQLRSATADAKEVALLRTMAEYRLTLPRNAAEWRYGGRRLGSHTALGFAVRVLATDGVVAWFLLGDGATTLFGHMSNFEATKEERVGKSPRKSKRQELLDSF